MENMAQFNEPLRISAYGHDISVDLNTGDFNIDGVTLPFKFSKHVDSEYPIVGPVRPIRFNRVTHSLPAGSREVVYAVGWQATVETSALNLLKGRWEPKQVNVKHILYLHPNGEMTFG